MNIKDTIDRQRIYFQSGATKSIPYRIEQLNALKKTIIKWDNSIIESIQSDCYKPVTEIYSSEIGYVLSEIDHHIGKIKTWTKNNSVVTKRINLPAKSYWYYEPYGVALIIGTWNYPMGLLFAPLVAAISAGNCVLLKPSEQAPHTAKCLENLIKETFAEEYIALIQGGPKEIHTIIDQSVDYIFFTGGIKAGKAIAQSAASNLIPFALELGGKNPCIVDKNTPLKNASKRIMWGKLFNAGQTCVAPDFCLVHESVMDSFIKECIQAIHDFYGDFPGKSKDFARIINQTQWRRLTQLLDYGTIACGGDYNETELYMGPTLITNPDMSSPLMKEEIFGPLLPILPFTQLLDVLNLLKNMPEPLALYCFSESKDTQTTIKNNSRSGTICFNGTLHSIISNTLPFGGVGASGIGRYHGKAGFETFSFKRSIMKKSARFGLDTMYPPYRVSLNMLKKVFSWLM